MKIGISTVQFNLTASRNRYKSIEEVPYWQLYCSKYDKITPGYKLPAVLNYEQVKYIVENCLVSRSFVAFPRKNFIYRRKYVYEDAGNMLTIRDAYTKDRIIVMSVDKDIMYMDQQYNSRVLHYCKCQCYKWAKARREQLVKK